MSLLPTDVNRPISDVTPATLVPDLEQVIERVIETVQPVEREVCDREAAGTRCACSPIARPTTGSTAR
jgi:hypothetical protein